MHDIDIILAECPGLGRVRLCECNSIHLTIGPVTLNLEPRALAQVGLLIRNASAELTTLLEARELGQHTLERTAELTH